jgi:TonB family protein
MGEGSWCRASAAPATVNGTKAVRDHCSKPEREGAASRKICETQKKPASQETCLSTSRSAILRGAGTVTIKTLDDVRVRLPFIALATSILWFGLLTIFGVLLNRSSAGSSVQPPVEINLIDLPGLAGGGGPSTGIAKSSSAPVSAPNPEKVPSHWKPTPVRPKAIHAVREHQFEARKSLTAVHHIVEANHSSLVQAVPTSVHAETSSANSSGPISGDGAARGTSSVGGMASVAGNGPGGAGPRTGNGGDFGNGGGSGPRAIYAPVPSIPDDLRDEVMQANAVVRFHVSRDGEAHAVLITSTDYSELDELILETLQRWRFSPAIRDGVKIDADAEVRLLVTVQ